MLARSLAVLLAALVLPAAAHAAPGDLDTDFDADGHRTSNPSPMDGGSAYGSDVLVDPEGRVVVAGSAEVPPGRVAVAVERLLPGGAPDTGFGQGGKQVIAFERQVAVEAVARDADGRLLVAGTAFDDAGDIDWLVLRLTAAGQLDTAFSADGYTTTSFPESFVELTDLVVDAAGRPVVVGTAGDRIAVARFEADGDLDLAFGDAGRVLATNPPGTRSRGAAVLLDPQGRVVVGGTEVPTGDGTQVLRIDRYLGANDDTGGDPDPGFGVGGRAVVQLPGFPEARALVREPDGKLVVGGRSGSSSWALGRVLADGRPDTAFGASGQLTHPMGTDGTIEDLVVHGEHLVAAGHTGSAFALARYGRAAGALDPGFGARPAFGAPATLKGAALAGDRLVGTGVVGAAPHDVGVAAWRLADQPAPPADRDADGVPDTTDNCDAVPNAGQADLDGDGRGDLCDADRDGDGVADASDTCPAVADPGQADADGDGTGDACDPTPSAPAPVVPAAPVADATRTIGAVVPIVVTRAAATMPDLAPRRAGRTWRFTSVATARRRLQALGVAVEVLERPGKASDVALDRSMEGQLERSGEGGELVSTSPAKGEQLVSTLGTPAKVRLVVYDVALERSFRADLAREARERLAVEQRRQRDAARARAVKRCPLLTLKRDELQELLGGRRFEAAPGEVARSFPDVSAVELLTKVFDCRWEATFKPAKGLVDALVVGGRNQDDGDLVQLDVRLPVRPDLMLTWREDPVKIASKDIASLAATSGGDWVVPVGAGGVRFTVQVNEIATGRFVRGAQLEVYSQSTGKRLLATTTDAQGERLLSITAPRQDRLEIIARVPGRNGVVAEGFRSIGAQALGKTFTTVCGRRMTRSGSSYKGVQAELDRCKGLPLVAGNLGTGAGAAPPRIARVGEQPVATFVPGGTGATALAGVHNAIEVGPENTIVASAPGVISVGGGNVISTGGLNAFDDGALHRWQQANPFAAIGTFLNAIVTPLRQAYDRGVGSVRAMLGAAGAAGVAKTSAALSAAGVPAPRPSELVPQGVGVISTGGGNIISNDGASVIATGGGNIISNDGAGLISDKGLGVIATGGGNVIATGGGNFVPVYGGRVISTGGGN